MILEFDSWVERFRPVKNPFDSEAEDEGFAFDLYGIQFEEIIKIANDNPTRIWTRVESDGYTTITSGLHFVNRDKYYITEVPCPTDEFIEIPLSDPSDFEGSDEDDEDEQD